MRVRFPVRNSNFVSRSLLIKPRFRNLRSSAIAEPPAPPIRGSDFTGDPPSYLDNFDGSHFNFILLGRDRPQFRGAIRFAKSLDYCPPPELNYEWRLLVIPRERERPQELENELLYVVVHPCYTFGVVLKNCVAKMKRKQNRFYAVVEPAETSGDSCFREKGFLEPDFCPERSYLLPALAKQWFPRAFIREDWLRNILFELSEHESIFWTRKTDREADVERCKRMGELAEINLRFIQHLEGHFSGDLKSLEKYSRWKVPTRDRWKPLLTVERAIPQCEPSEWYPLGRRWLKGYFGDKRTLEHFFPYKEGIKALKRAVAMNAVFGFIGGDMWYQQVINEHWHGNFDKIGAGMFLWAIVDSAWRHCRQGPGLIGTLRDLWINRATESRPQHHTKSDFSE